MGAMELMTASHALDPIIPACSRLARRRRARYRPIPRPAMTLDDVEAFLSGDRDDQDDELAA
jgi:hypothetical protein